MFIYKQCPSLFGRPENCLVKTRNFGILERSWTGSVFVQCRDQKIIPDTGELVFSERSMVNCFAQKLKAVFARADCSKFLMSSGFIFSMLSFTFLVVV